MLSTESIDVVLRKLAKGDKESVVILDQFLKSIIKTIENTEELKEEIDDFTETYQFHVTDLNFNFWFSIYKKKITYEKGINKTATLKVFFTKDILVKVIKKEISGTELYMKGLIKVKGNLSHAVKIMNFLRTVRNYLLNNSKNSNS
ncbi:MAG: SCP2 sterol-binding domain-containing protein [Candidatus Hermodarchaeota archaeon]